MTQTPSPFGQPMGMFNQSPPPAQWMPFGMNVGGGGGGGMGQMLLQLLMPALAQSMGGPQNFPAQFLPSQGVWDQMQAQRYWRGQNQAMNWAADLDVASMHRTMVGGHRMMFDQAPTVQQQQQYRGMAETAGQFLPAATMLLGPETVDALMGPRGSAVVMAQQMHRGLRAARDPATGAMGVRGPAAGLMTQEIYGQLYGPGANLAEMRGMTAGQTGALFELLQQRGMAGPALGARGPEARLSALAGGDFQRAGTQRRIAEAYLRNQGRDVTPTTIEAAREQVFGQGGTFGQIQAGVASGNIDVQRMMEMPGTEEMLSTSQAQTISRRLKNLSGAVSAMRDIFGDLGRPDAPMQELIQGLEALTQGGLASMTPGQLEQAVRTTKNLAQVSGLGIQGMAGLQAQNANLADRLGLDRTLVMGATDRTAAWAAAARQTQRLDMPAFGQFTAEEQVILGGQIEMGAMASQIGNMVGATVRLQKEGLIQAGTDADRLAQAVMVGQTTWTDAAGRQRRVAMNNAEWMQVMQTGGMEQATAEAVLSDPYASQQYIRDQNLGGLVRGLQREVDIEPRVADVFGNALRVQINQQGVGEVLRRRLGMDERGIAGLTRAAAGQAAQQLFELDAETMNDPKRRNQAMGQIAENAVAAQVRAAGGNAADVQAALGALGPEGALEMGVSMLAGLGRHIRHDPNMAGYKSVVGLWQMHTPATLVRRDAEVAEAQTRGRMQAAMSSIGRHGPLTRLIGEMQDAPAGQARDEMFKRIMGFVPVQGAGGGIRAALEGYEQAERYTQETVLQEEMDRTIAREKRITLEDYRAQIQGATGDERTRLIEERDRLRTDLSTDPDFMRRMHRGRGAFKARIGTLTERGMQQQELWTTVLEGLDKGGQWAELARQEIAQEIGGADVPGGDMTAEWWEAQKEAARTPRERQRIERYQQASDLLWRVQRGETITPPGEQGAPGEDASGAGDVGRKGLIFGDPLARQPPVNRQAGGAGGGGDGQDRRITARMSGTLTIAGNQAEIAGDMELGDLQHNDVQTEVATSPTYFGGGVWPKS